MFVLNVSVSRILFIIRNNIVIYMNDTPHRRQCWWFMGYAICFDNFPAYFTIACSRLCLCFIIHLYSKMPFVRIAGFGREFMMWYHIVVQRRLSSTDFSTPVFKAFIYIDSLMKPLLTSFSKLNLTTKRFFLMNSKHTKDFVFFNCGELLPSK